MSEGSRRWHVLSQTRVGHYIEKERTRILRPNTNSALPDFEKKKRHGILKQSVSNLGKAKKRKAESALEPPSYQGSWVIQAGNSRKKFLRTKCHHF